MYDITMHIVSLPHYIRSSADEQILCGLDITLSSESESFSFRCQSSDQCIRETLSETEAFLEGRLTDRELWYFDPKVAGTFIVYPYSFAAKDGRFFFRYRECQNKESFDFEGELRRESVIALHEQLEKQYAAMDWDSLGKVEIYTVELPGREFEWCYSADELAERLQRLCVGRQITDILISSLNYSSPLRVREDYVNFYLGSEVLILTDGVLLDLLVYAEGLFKLRVFSKGEYSIGAPNMEFMRGCENEYCRLGNAYGIFEPSYTGIDILNVEVKKTTYARWTPRNFDKSRLGDPVALPKILYFRLADGRSLSLHGWDDDFIIKLSPFEEEG